MAAAVIDGGVTGSQAPLGPSQEASSAKRRRTVAFAPGPDCVANKYGTQDGHPDHEGQVAVAQRRLSLSFGADITPGAVRALEIELGEDCRPSLDRLKRRVGLLPLRRREREYALLIGGAAPDGGADESEGRQQQEAQQQQQQDEPGKLRKPARAGGQPGAASGSTARNGATAQAGGAHDSSASGPAGAGRPQLHVPGGSTAGAGAGGAKALQQNRNAQRIAKRLGSLSDPITVGRGVPRSLSRPPAMLRASSAGPAK